MRDSHTSNGSGDLFRQALDQEVASNGGSIVPDPSFRGSVGVTMFDVTGSKDNVVTVLVKKEHVGQLPSQAMVEVRSRRDGDSRVYLGIVTGGPFFQPDGLRPDSPIIVTTAVNGMTFIPNYHGRVLIEILAEIKGETMFPPKYRPLPNSPVFRLESSATRKALNLEGDIALGRAIGHDNLEVLIPSTRKSVLPRHLGVLGTTGGGKSTSVAGLIYRCQKQGIATILLDTEGEYTQISEPTTIKNMLNILESLDMEAEGVSQTRVLYPVGRETTNPDHPRARAFSLRFDQISPYAVMEILDLTDAQKQRYLKAYDVARRLLRQLKIFPSKAEDEDQLERLDDMETGYPCLTLAMMYDLICALGAKANKTFPTKDDNRPFPLRSERLAAHQVTFVSLVNQVRDVPGNVHSWRALQGKLGRLLRLKIFDNPVAKPLDFHDLTAPGNVSIIDLSDTDSPQINNLVIAELLRGTLEMQDSHYKRFHKGETDRQNKVMVVIEEAHEFLSQQRIKQMPVLYQQVARIARRGRKRWLGLTFVTQLPQHLPDEVLTLINSFILHKIGDANVINRLRRSIGGVDESLWKKLTQLSAGQAIVTTPAMKRALLVAIHPTPCQLRMVE